MVSRPPLSPAVLLRLGLQHQPAPPPARLPASRAPSTGSPATCYGEPACPCMLACPSLSLLGSSSVLACPCRSLIRHACNPHACPSLSSSRPVNACMHACMPSRHLTSVVHPRVQPHQHRLALDGRQELNRRPVREGGARRLALGRRPMARVHGSVEGAGSRGSRP